MAKQEFGKFVGQLIQDRRVRSSLRLEAESLVRDMSSDSGELVFAADYDGTVTEGDLIPRRVRTGVRKAARRGVRTTIITGRPWHLFPEEAKKTLLRAQDMPLVTGGGSTVTRRDGNGESTIQTEGLTFVTNYIIF